jgi:hypothetical protein
MTPEILMERPSDLSADVYAFGMLAYYVLTG